MADHGELVSEIGVIEKMTTTERLKHAKKRRQTQLKKYSQYEKNLDKEQAKKSKKSNKKVKKTNNNARRVIFVDNVMLLEAAARNDIEEVRLLLSKEVSPDVTNEDGLTALHQCCIDDLDEMMKLLLAFGANVNARDSELWTPLHAAATCGHVHLCKYLIDNGAELLAVNADGNMPYDICEDEETLDFIENEMAKRGVTQELIDETRLSTERQMLDDLRAIAADNKTLESTGRSGETPLHIAAANGYVEVGEFLLEQRVRVDTPDADSWQPIHAAACWGHLPMLEILVHYGADLDARTKNGETPYDICEDPEIRDRILEMRTEIESNKRTRSQRLVRRRSTNTRSPGSAFHNSTGSLYSSNQSLQGDRSGALRHDSTDGSPHYEHNRPSASTVRRSSVRGKGAMYLKEAKEEAERLRETVTSNDDDEDEDAAQRSVSLVSEVEDITIALNGTDSSNTHTEENETAPSHLSSTDTDPPVYEEQSVRKSPQPPQHEFVDPPNVSQNKAQSSPRPIKNHAPPPPAVNSQKTLTPKPASSPASSPSMQHRQPQAPPTPPQAQPAQAQAPPSRSNAPPPPAQPQAPPPQEQESGRALSTVEEQSEPQQNYIPKQQQPNSNAAAAASNPAAAAGLDPFLYPPTGTLADLKKKRAQELRDSMRFRDATRLNAEVAKHNESYEANTNGHQAPAAPANGQNGAVRRDSDASYYGLDDPPKHKFTASTQEIVGGHDNQTGCCVLM